jgi:hypothetical protein
MITREQLIDECCKDGNNGCHRCGGTGKIYVSVGGGCMGYDDEERPCPECKHPNKEGQYEAPSPVGTGGFLLTCPQCGGSLCAEEWHDCERDREWRYNH